MSAFHHRMVCSAIVCVWAAFIGAGAVQAQSAAPRTGEAVYLQHCAMCHEQVTDRIPHRDALKQMPATRILRALDAGAMMAVALTMHRDDRIAVARYLGTDATDTGPPPA